MKQYLLILGVAIMTSNALGQQIKNPSVKRSEIPYCKITGILTTFEKTIVEFDYVSPNTNINPVSVCASDNFFIRDNETGEKFFLIKANLIPICPQNHHFSHQGESLQFSLEFQPLPKRCKEIDIIENLTGEGLNFYGVGLISTAFDTKSSETKNNEEVTYSLTMTSEGKLKNKGDLFGEVIYTIPRGAVIEIYSINDGYYKVNHNGTTGYLSEIYFRKNDYISKQANQSAKKSRDQNKIKSLSKDGRIFQYYIHDGISVTIHLSIENNNNKYFIAYVSIENLTGKAFGFDPNSIKAVLLNNETLIYGKVMPSSELSNISNNRISWKSVLTAFEASSDLNQEEFLISSTKSFASEYSNSYGNTSEYYKSRNASTTKPKNDKSYKEEVSDAVQRKIRNNYKINNVLNLGYLKSVTIDNEQRVVGQLFIKYKNADIIQITLPVNGEFYDFKWNIK